MKERILIIFLIILVVINLIFVIIFRIKNEPKSATLKRYEEIKNDIDEEMERYLYFIAPNCSSENAGGFLTHKNLVYNNGFDKEKLLDIDSKSYCKAYIQYKCVIDGKWKWNTTISCKDYEDKDYKDWDKGFEPQK